MADVFGAEKYFHFPVHWNAQSCSDNVILGGRIVLAVEAKEVSGGIVHFVHMNRAELAIRSGIAKVPGELLSLRFNLQGAGSCAGEMHGGPDPVSHQIKADKQNGRGRGPGGLQTIVPVRVDDFAAIALVAVLEDKPGKAELSEDKNNPANEEG